MNNDSKARFSDPDLWIRLLYMILFAVLTWLSRLVLCVIGLLQFLVVLLSGAENRSLRDFSASLAEWTLRAFRFICFNSEQKPFPFDEWPEPEGEVMAATVIAVPASDDNVAAAADVVAATEESAVMEAESTETESTVAEASEIESPVSHEVEDLPVDDAEDEEQNSAPQPKP